MGQKLVKKPEIIHVLLREQGLNSQLLEQVLQPRMVSLYRLRLLRQVFSP